MNFPRISFPRGLLLLAFLAGLTTSALSAEKGGMPDLAQIDQTCLPTSTANLLIWFGRHGYPNLIAKGDPGDTDSDREQHTVHRIMTATQATYQWGTPIDGVTDGIRKYVQAAGYSCDVEYRGLDWAKALKTLKAQMGEPDNSTYVPVSPFKQEWLNDNDDPNKGFILLLSYIRWDQNGNTFNNAWNAGHAVTLVNAEPDMLLVHDPAHLDDETGRKILSPQELHSGTWVSKGLTSPVAGLLMLSGSLLDAPPRSAVLLTGAICVTMRPLDANGAPTLATTLGGATNAPSIGGGGSPAPLATPTPATAPTSSTTGWVMWVLNIFFKK